MPLKSPQLFAHADRCCLPDTFLRNPLIDKMVRNDLDDREAVCATIAQAASEVDPGFRTTG
jgi:hypothetical protein